MQLIIFKKMKIMKNFTLHSVYEINAQNLTYIHDAINIFKSLHRDVILTFYVFFYFYFSVSLCVSNSSVSVFFSVSDYVGSKTLS